MLLFLLGIFLGFIITLKMLRVKNVRIDMYVPKEHVNRVLGAMCEAGAGFIGNYDYCSFCTEGVATFRPLRGAEPTIGRIGEFISVPEVCINIPCPRQRLKKVIEAARRVHPYETMGYNIIDIS